MVTWSFLPFGVNVILNDNNNNNNNNNNKYYSLNRVRSHKGGF